MLKKDLKIAYENAMKELESLRDSFLEVEQRNVALESHILFLQNQNMTSEQEVTGEDGRLLGTFQAIESNYSCGLVDAGHPEPYGYDDETFYEAMLDHLYRGEMRKADGFDKQVGLWVFSDALGGEEYADGVSYAYEGMDEDEDYYGGIGLYEHTTVWAMFKTAKAQRMIERGIISVSECGFNPNSGHPIRTYTVRTRHHENHSLSDWLNCAEGEEML